MFNLGMVSVGRNCFVSFQRNVKLNLESPVALLWALEVAEITDCTAEVPCLMMSALCSTGFSAAVSFLFLFRDLVGQSTGGICSRCGQGLARANGCYVALSAGLHCVACLPPTSYFGLKLGPNRFYN